MVDRQLFSSLGLPDEELDRLVYEYECRDLQERIAVARVRCLTFPQLLSRLDRIWEEADPELVMRRFAELDLADEQGRAVDRKLQELDRIAERLPRVDRDRIDRAVSRISRSLPLHLARERAVPDLLRNPRKLRQEHAAKVLARVGISKGSAEQFLNRCAEVRDQELLELIARHPEAVAETDLSFLLNHLEEQY